jgi:hypothetical protein
VFEFETLEKESVDVSVAQVVGLLETRIALILVQATQILVIIAPITSDCFQSTTGTYRGSSASVVTCSANTSNCVSDTSLGEVVGITHKQL